MKSGFFKTAVLAAAALLALCAAPQAPLGQTPVQASAAIGYIAGDPADEIIVWRAMRLAFLGRGEGSVSWLPSCTFYACNSQKQYTAGEYEFSMPYSRSALFNGTEFGGLQQYIGWVDPDSGRTPSYEYSVSNFVKEANTPGSVFDLASHAAAEQGANWGALLGSDCSAFLSYAWQVPHMTTFMFTSDAVDWNICREVPATRGHQSKYGVIDLAALRPGDAMVCCNRSGTDENGNPLYRGHCIIITRVGVDSNGKPVTVDTVEEISPRAIAKSRSADEFLAYANKLHSSGAYYKFYRLVSKRHLKLELEITYDPAGGSLEGVENGVEFVFARDAAGYTATYDGLISRTPTRPGYEFLGWGLTAGGSDVISPGTPIALTTDHTLYARWRAAD
ncbi:MAG: InlB B-repeat-containing protein [Clostridia bacterium]|nr:InlB B-repeat-containing protein [Clostridia bacterium]